MGNDRSLRVGICRSIAILTCMALVSTACEDNRRSDAVVGSAGQYSSGSAVCGLLQQRELEAVLAREFKAGTAPGFVYDVRFLPGITTCSFSETGISSGLEALNLEDPELVKRKVYLGVVYAYSSQIFQEHRSKLQPKGQKGLGADLRRIGDDGFWWPDQNQFYVLKNKKMLVLQFRPEALESRRDNEQRARRLLTFALKRLK